MTSVASLAHDSVHDFLAGGGPTGAYLRTVDWQRTRVGVPENWSQALRTTVRLIMNTNHPMYIFWGETGTCFYNQAYSQSIGPERHPSSLGREARDVWAEIWPIIGPQIDQVMAGGGATWHENALVPITRNGRREDVYWTYSYGPIDDDTMPGGIGGVLVICSETTEAVQLQRRLAFQVQIDEALRSSHDPQVLATLTIELLGLHLNVGRCGFCEVDTIGTILTVHQEWTDGTMVSLAGSIRLDAFGPEVVANLKSGQILTIRDVLLDSPLEEHVCADQTAGGFRAGIAAPAFKDCQLAAVFYVHQTQSRIWSNYEIALVGQIAERVWAKIERTRAEKALLAASMEVAKAAERAQEIADAMPNHVWAADADGSIRWFNKRVYEFSGAEIGELDGAEWASIVHPEDITQAAARWTAAIATGENYETEFRLRRADGVMRCHLARAVLLRDPAGHPLRWIGTNTDIDDQRRVTSELADSERRFRLSQRAAGIAAMEIDLATDLVHGSPELWAMFGLPYVPGTTNTIAFEACVLAEDRTLASIANLPRDDLYKTSAEFRVRRADTNEIRWITRHMEFVRAQDGTALKMYGALRDITSEKDAEIRQKMLTEELAHRIKNILATVQAISSQTLRNTTIEDARKALSDRLRALGAVHSLLSNTNWTSAHMTEVVSSAIAAFPSKQMDASGEEVLIGPKRALSMALALNELGTNSLKYGALSVPGGHVRIEWTKATDADGTDRIVWTWLETGGPNVKPPTRKGFGRFLIETVMAQDYHGEVSIEFAPTGVKCALIAPWPSSTRGV